MERYKEYAIISVFVLILGVVSLAYGASMDIPSQYKTFLGIPYATNPEYATTLFYKLASIMIGCLLLGWGVGLWAPIVGFYKLESETILPKTQPAKSEILFCRYCGREKKPDAMYCEACGKKL